jgi:hypothetical protein
MARHMIVEPPLGPHCDLGPPLNVDVLARCSETIRQSIAALDDKCSAGEVFTLPASSLR